MGICLVPTAHHCAKLHYYHHLHDQHYHYDVASEFNGPFLTQESEFGDLMLQYDLEEVNFCDFRFTLSDFHPPIIKINSRNSRDSRLESPFLELMLLEQRLTVHSQFLLACGEQLHPCYQDNLIEVEVRKKLKKIFHRNILEEMELKMIRKFSGFKISHDSLLAW